METEHAIWLYQVDKSFHRRVLSQVDWQVPRGVRVLVQGRSGAGKTTLLDLLYGRTRPDSGQVVLLGKNLARLSRRGLARLRRRVGYVFQELELCLDRTVLWNVSLPLYFAGLWGRKAAVRAEEVCRLVGLDAATLGVRVRELSAGDRQLLSVARAVVGRPEVVLADEPTARLDTAQSLRVLDFLGRLARRGTTVVVATGEMMAMGAFRADLEFVFEDGRLSGLAERPRRAAAGM